MHEHDEQGEEQTDGERQERLERPAEERPAESPAAPEEETADDLEEDTEAE